MIQIILFFYNLLLIILLFPILLAIALSGKKNRQDFFYCIKERLAITDMPKIDKSKKTVWLHCASLGEAKALEPLLQHLSDCNIIITSITKSAREYVSKLNNISFYSLAPVDLYPFVKKTITKFNPDVLILIETEFWPNMIYLAHKHGTKIITVNGRISKNAFPYYKITTFFWRPFLKLIDYISVRNEFDYNRFVSLVGNNKTVGITGNVKYDRDFAKESISRKSLGCKETDLIWVAGSIRGKEISIIIEAFKNLKRGFNNLKLIVAPRHLTQIPALKCICEMNGLKYSLFSEIKDKTNDILLVDVFGQLQKIYSVSDVVYVGGSLVKTGGQNPIEPAAYSKPIVFGQHMYNFEIESKLLKDNGGAAEVKTKDELIMTLALFLKNKELRDGAGANAQKTVVMQKGAIKANMDLIRKYI